MCVNTVIEHKYVRDRDIPESHTAGEMEERTQSHKTLRNPRGEQASFGFKVRACDINRYQSKVETTHLCVTAIN